MKAMRDVEEQEEFGRVEDGDFDRSECTGGFDSADGEEDGDVKYDVNGKEEVLKSTHLPTNSVIRLPAIRAISVSDSHLIKC